MRVKWATVVLLLSCILLLTGCRSSQPNLKPPDTPEQLKLPPTERRYEVPEYPKAALNSDDPTKRYGLDSKMAPAQGMGRNAMMPGAGGIGGVGAR